MMVWVVSSAPLKSSFISLADDVPGQFAAAKSSIAETTAKGLLVLIPKNAWKGLSWAIKKDDPKNTKRKINFFIISPILISLIYIIRITYKIEKNINIV